MIILYDKEDIDYPGIPQIVDSISREYDTDYRYLHHESMRQTADIYSKTEWQIILICTQIVDIYAT